MMEKEQIIAFLKEHPENLYWFCEEFGLRFPYDNKQEILDYYNFYKEKSDEYLEKYDKETDKELKKTYLDLYHSLKHHMEDLEKTYHLFDPKFDPEREKLYYVPEDYSKKAHEVYEYRKKLFDTQSAWADLELDNIIQKDISYIWSQKNGQDGIYQSLPIVFNRKSIVRENDDYCEFLESEAHHKTELRRYYALGSGGGIAIIERRYHTHYQNPEIKNKDYYTPDFRIVTLGEDDGYYFLSSANVFEPYCGDDKSSFTKLLELAKKEFENDNI